jgi:hypothetical protein
MGDEIRNPATAAADEVLSVLDAGTQSSTEGGMPLAADGMCWRCTTRPALEDSTAGVCEVCRQVLLDEAYSAPDEDDQDDFAERALQLLEMRHRAILAVRALAEAGEAGTLQELGLDRFGHVAGCGCPLVVSRRRRVRAHHRSRAIRRRAKPVWRRRLVVVHGGQVVLPSAPAGPVVILMGFQAPPPPARS